MKITYYRNIRILVLISIVNNYGDKVFRLKDVAEQLVRSVILDSSRKKTLAYYKKSYLPVVFSRLRENGYISYVEPSLKGWGGYQVTPAGREVYKRWTRDQNI